MPGTPIYITTEERKQLAAADMGDDRQLETQRDIFVFLCMIGCRVIFESTSWLMRRCGKIKPEEVAVDMTIKPAVPEVTLVDASPESEQNRRVLENAIDTVCRYTDLVLGDAVSDEDKKLLHAYLTDLTNMRPLPANVRQDIISGNVGCGKSGQFTGMDKAKKSRNNQKVKKGISGSVLVFAK